MASEYYLLIDKVQQGPFPVDQLKAQGLTPETMVWCKGMPQWIKAREEPALRHLFPYQPPKRDTAPPAAESAPSETEAAPATKSKPKKTKGNLADSPVERLKDWYSGLDPAKKRIGMTVVAALVLIPLAWAGASAMGLVGGKKDPFPTVDRDTSLDDDDKTPGRKKPGTKKKTDTGNKVAAKTPNNGHNEKQNVKVAAKNQANDNDANNFGKKAALPPGRLSEEYYRLVRHLSYERIITGNAFQNGKTKSKDQVVADYKSLAKEAKDDRIREFATEAAALWESRPKGTGTSVARVGVGVTGIRPGILIDRLAGNGIDSNLYKFELRQQKLWNDVLSHMRNALDRSGRLTPALVRFQIREPQTKKKQPGRDVNPTVGRALRFAAVNTANQHLHHVTLRVTYETPWGVKTTSHFYRDSWEDGKKWLFEPGPLWGAIGRAQTGGGEITVWSDEGVMPPTKVVFTTRFPEVVQLGLEYCETKLALGRYATPLIVSGGTAKNADVQATPRGDARTLFAKAQRIKRNHVALLAATEIDKTFAGVWRFGKYHGDIALKFQRLAKVPGIRRGNQNVNNENSRVQTPTAAILYAPERPPEYKRINGLVEFLPRKEKFVLTLGTSQVFGAGSQQIGVDGKPTRLPDTTANYLLKTTNRRYLFEEKDGELHGRTRRGDRLVLVPANRSNHKSRIAQLKAEKPSYEAEHHVATVAPIPADLVQEVNGRFPQTIDWRLGEIRRFDTAGDDLYNRKKNAKKKWSPTPVVQVAFPPTAAYLYGVTEKHTIAWNPRNAREEFRRNTGYPIVISAFRRFIAVPGTSGTRLFNARKGTRHASKIDTSSNAVAFGINARLLATAGTDGRVDVWDLNKGRLMTGKHSTAVTAVAISPNGQLVASASKDHKISLWSIADKGKYVGGVDAGEFDIYRLEFSQDSKHLMTFAKAESNNRFPVTTNNEPKKIDPLQEFAAPSRYEVKVWNVASKESIYRARIGRQANCLDISRDWRYALTGENDGVVSLWDLRRGVETHRFVGHTEATKAVAFTPDGRFFATGSDDGYAILWGLPGREKKLEPPPKPKKKEKATASLQGTRIRSAGTSDHSQ